MSESVYIVEFVGGPESLPVGLDACPIDGSTMTYDTESWKCADFEHAFRIFATSDLATVYRPVRLYHPGVTMLVAVASETVNASEATNAARDLSSVVSEVAEVSEGAEAYLV